MVAVHETAYPRLKAQLSDKELIQFFTPTEEERKLSEKHTRDDASQIIFLTLLKTFQRLGYFLTWNQVPEAIPNHICHCLGFIFLPHLPDNYDQSGNRSRHIGYIRNYLKVTPAGEATYLAMRKAGKAAAQTKEHLADIINVMIEELVRQRYELPAFSRFVREAYSARSKVNQDYFSHTAQLLSSEQKVYIDQLLDLPLEKGKSMWNQLKREPSAPTITRIKAYLEYVRQLKETCEAVSVEFAIPAAKLQQFYYEARAAELSRLKEFTDNKKYAFVVILIERQMARALDNVAHLFIRQVYKLHNKAKESLEKYHQNSRERMGELVEYLAKITQAFQSEGSKVQRFEAIEEAMPESPEQVLEQCHQHMAYAQNNHLLCLIPHYLSRRPLFFDCLDVLQLNSSSQDHQLIHILEFIAAHRNSRKEWISLPQSSDDNTKTKQLPLDWIPDKWRKLVMGKSSKQTEVLKVNRKYLELCTFSELMRQLKSGDMYVKGSIEFDDYRKRLISWEVYRQEIKDYKALSGILTDAEQFIAQIKGELIGQVNQTDASFPENEYARIENGELILSYPSKEPLHKQYDFLDNQIKDRINPINILDILVDTEKWLNLSRNFHSISGHQTNIPDYPERFISTLFCYGCFLGPSETARSIPGISRKQLAWINHHHVTEERLNKAVVRVINAYNQFRLPKYWGSGKSASADGTKWDVYEKNLLAEYHIRYGGYGGIGYYHVSDTYIALFSHFIPCGVHEAIYILDGLLKNTSDIRPDTVHGDTHAQNTVVFGLAYLLGIKLMPRIKKIKHITYFRPEKKMYFEHIDDLFSESINWKLIQTHLPDMLRVVLSIKTGKITPSTILRRLGTHSRKNKLYFAFRELGRAVRTSFAMQYIRDVKLRRTIHAATNKSEGFNHFSNWLAFASKIIPENLRHEQTKVIKYNHLMANLVILYNVNQMTRVLNDLGKEGHEIDQAVLKELSPYRTEHISRFGSYVLNMEREVQPLSPELQITKSS